MNARRYDGRGLLSWQWAAYPAAHRDRRNLLVHALTVPAFCAGTAALVLSPALGAVWGISGAVAAAVAIGAQGRTHGLEAARPDPFRGPADVLLRILAEQWVTFPRYVLSGAFARAWRAGGDAPAMGR
jgi:hypothetical protein